MAGCMEGVASCISYLITVCLSSAVGTAAPFRHHAHLSSVLMLSAACAAQPLIIRLQELT